MVQRLLRTCSLLALVSMLLGGVPPATVSPMFAASAHQRPIAGPARELPTTPVPAAVASPAVPHPEPPPPSLSAQAPIRDNGQSQAQNRLHIPLSFIANSGQTDASVQYYVRSLGGTVFFSPQEVTLSLLAEPQRHGKKPFGDTITSTLPISTSVIRLRYEGVGANTKIKPNEQLPGVANIYIGNDGKQQKTQLPTYAGITYQELYPGINVQFDGTDGHLKSTYTIAAGANINRLRWRYVGAKDLHLDDSGNLLVRIAPPSNGRPNATATFTLTEQVPVAWQMIDNQRRAVDVHYTIATSGVVGFGFGVYDTTKTLYIDPTLVYSNSVGSSGGDIGADIASYQDANGVTYYYIVGSSSSATFPNGLNGNLGNYDAIVLKFNSNGTLIYSTFIGGGDDDRGNAIAVDDDGNAYITGSTHSSSNVSPSFPTTTDAYKPTNTSIGDAFIVKLNSSGAIIYSSYYGGLERDSGNGIAIKNRTNGPPYIYITGSLGDNPIKGFIAKIDITVTPNYNQALYTRTFNNNDGMNDIHIDANGNVFAVGDWVTSPSQGDVFVIRVDDNPASPTYGSVIYNNTFGGSDFDIATKAFSNSGGDIYITGLTRSLDFPLSSNAYTTTCGHDGLCNTISLPGGGSNVDGDTFVAIINAAGTRTYSTYLGGGNTTAGSIGNDIYVDSNGNIYLAGDNLPHKNVFLGTATWGASFAKINSAVSGNAALLYSTPVASLDNSSASGFTISNAGIAYLTGRLTGATDDILTAAIDVNLQNQLRAEQARALGEECLSCAIHRVATVIANVFTSKPVNTRTGNFWTNVTDLAVQSPGPALAWSRSYASQATEDLTTILGFGWQHPYAARLILPTAAGGDVTVLSGLGNQLRFVDTGNGTYQANAGIYSTMVRANGVYTQTLRDQQQLVFSDTTGQLVRMRDALGRALTLTYSGTPARLTQIADANDSTRKLTLTYYASGRINTVSDGTRTVTYTYDAITGDLKTVQDVRGQTTQYAYTTHLLTKITDPLGQAVEQMGYTGLGNASKVITQTLQTGEQLQFQYLSASTVMTTTGVDGRRDVQTIAYGGDNAMTGMTINGQAVVGTGFDGSFSPASVVDGRGNPTTTTYTTNGLPVQQINALNQTTRFQYDANRPTLVTDTLGIATRYDYDKLGNLLKTTAGITTTSSIRATTIYTYSYLTASNVWSTLAQPLTIPLPKDSRLLEQSGPDGVVTHYDYDAVKAHQITKMTVGFGTALAQATTYGYDTLGRPTSTTTAFGTALARTDTTTYNPDNTVAQTIQNYKDGIFSAAKPDEDSSTTYGYDALGRQIWVKDVLGHYDITHYNAKGQVDWTTRNMSGYSGGALPATPPAYSPATTDANVATFYGYDGLSRTVLVTETGILTGTFNPATLQFSAATTRVTRTEYDTLSRPMTVTLNYRPGLPQTVDTNIATYTRYDGASNVITQTDALGRWTVTQYDALNRPVKVIANYQDGNPLTGPRDSDIVTVTKYDAAGRTDRTIDNWVDGTFSATEPITDRVTLYQYDTLSRATTTTVNYAPGNTAPELNRTSTTAYHPTTGRVTGQQDVLGRWVSQQYDLLGRVTKTIQNCVGGSPPASCTGSVTVEQNVATLSAYDTLNRTTIVTDALNFGTRTFYDGLGRTTQQVRNYKDGGFVDSKPDEDLSTSYRYDALGRTLTLTDTVSQNVNAITAYGVNNLGQTISTTDPAGRVTLNGYDGSGTLRWTKRPDGQVMVYQIDGLGRIIATIVNYKDGVVGANEPVDTDLTSKTVLDKAGRRVQTIDAAGRITAFAYDNLDRLLGVTENVASGTCPNAPCNVVTQYQYDRVGNQTAMIDARGYTRRFVYDAASQQTSATDALNRTTSWQYDAAGRKTTQTDPRGAAYNLTFGYDGVDRLKTTSATNLGTITQNYDALGRRTSLVDGTGTTTFTPDALGRVTQLTAPNTGSVQYGYNGRGDRIKLTYPTTGTTVNYAYFADGRLNTVTQGVSSPPTIARYTYDAVGRLAQAVTNASASSPSQLVTNYRYDGADRLTRQRTSEAGTPIAGFDYQLNRNGLRTVITETLPLSPTLSTTRIKTVTFEGASLIDANTGVSSVNGTVQLAATALKGFYAAAVNTASSYLIQSIANVDEVYVTFYLRVDATQATTAPIIQILNGATVVGVLQLTNANKLRLLNNTTQIGIDAPTALTVGTVYRVGLHQKKSTASNGILEAYVVQGDAPFGNPFAADSAQTFTTQATQLQIGAPSSTKATLTVDDIALDTLMLAPPSQIMALRAESSDTQATDTVMSLASGEPSLRTAATNQAIAPSTVPLTSTNAPAFGNLPLTFMPNAGQHDPAVRYHVRSLGGTIFFTPQQVVLAVPTDPRANRTRLHEHGHSTEITATVPISMSIVRLQYEGAGSNTALTATDQLSGTANFFLGNDPAKWQTNLPTYGGVVYQHLYPGIDLHYTGTDGHLKSTYIVAPGSDPTRLRWRYQGAKDVQVDPVGNLQIILDPPGKGRIGATIPYTLTEQAPVAWQVISGQQVPVDAHFVVDSSKRVSFVLGAYDATQPLIIDPTLVYSTYLGGSGSDFGYGIALDSAGNAYVTGRTLSTNFPAQSAYDSTTNGSGDVFITKLNAAGSALLYSTYLGSSGDDYGAGIAVDGTGAVYIAGHTESAAFPLKNAYQSTYGGGGPPFPGDAFVTKLNAAGNQLLYSSFLGGGNGEWSSDSIAIDSAGNMYVSGETYWSATTAFPTKNALKSTVTGGTDAFVAKFNPAASGAASLIYSTLLGGNSDDHSVGIAVDGAGNAYVTGATSSYSDATHTPFPTTTGAYSTTNTTASWQSFITKLAWNSGTSTLSYAYSTYFGGNGDEDGYAIAVDSSNTVYVTGFTQSTNLPMQNAWQSSCASTPCWSAFVLKLNPALSGTAALLYSTYLGGSASENDGFGIAVDRNGLIYVTGQTNATDFPLVTPIQSTAGGGMCSNNGGPIYPCLDAFVTKIDPALPAAQSLVYSTLLGGSSDDQGDGIVVDSGGTAYVTGATASSDFPTGNPQQSANGGGTCGGATDPCRDAFIVKLSPTSRIKDITFEGGSLTDIYTGVDSVSGAATLDIGAAIKGVDAARIPNNTAYLEENFVGVEDLYLAFYVKLNALPSTDARIAMISNAGTTVGNITLRTNGTLRLRNNSTQVGSDSTLALQPNMLYRIGLHQKKGTGSNAVLEAYVVSVSASGDVAFGTPFATMNNGTWTNKADRVRLGATNGNAVDLWLDDIGLDTAAMPTPSMPQSVRIVRHTYDGLQRLIGTVESPGNTYAYGYDLAGNRTSVQRNGGTPTTVTYNGANQITTAGYTYDFAGNLTNDGTTTYTYDALNRLTARGSTTYAYNGDGTLVAQTASSVTTRYTQDLASPLSQILQTQVGAAARTDSLFALGRIATLTSGVKTWYVPDALGSVRRTVSEAGVPLGVVNYDPWGTVENGSVPTFGFTGELQQGGDVYLRARWYNSGRGAFGSRDPFTGTAEQPYSLHPYQYAYSAPTTWADPSGREPWWTDPDFRRSPNEPRSQDTARKRAECSEVNYYNTIAVNKQNPARCWDPAVDAAFISHSASLALDMSPAGPVKGLIEVGTGCDLITGDKLGNWRYLGLLGIFSAFKLVKELRGVAKVASSTAGVAEEISELPRTLKAVEAMEEFSTKSNILNPPRQQSPFSPLQWRLHMDDDARAGLEAIGYRYYIYTYQGEVRARFMLNVHAPTPDYLIDELGSITTKPANLEALPRTAAGEPSGGEALIKFAVEQGIAERGNGAMFVNSTAGGYNFYKRLGFVESKSGRRGVLILTQEAALKLIGR